jgi:hypothetical protein
MNVVCKKRNTISENSCFNVVEMVEKLEALQQVSYQQVGVLLEPSPVLLEPLEVDHEYQP